MRTIKFITNCWISYGFLNGEKVTSKFEFNQNDTCKVENFNDKVKLILNNGDSFILPKTGSCGFKNYQKFLNREHELFEFVD